MAGWPLHVQISFDAPKYTRWLRDEVNIKRRKVSTDYSGDVATIPSSFLRGEGKVRDPPGLTFADQSKSSVWFASLRFKAHVIFQKSVAPKQKTGRAPLAFLHCLTPLTVGGKASSFLD
jgi:hypothetical protein